ncbi:MAG: cytochrome c biogenesis protein CcsA [Gammaproteobacteria bacterium]
MKINWFKYAAPVSFYSLAGKLIPFFWLATIVLIPLGLYLGFFTTPDTLGNGMKEYYRIIYVHVAASWMAMWLYAVMVGWALIGLIFNTRLSYMMASATAFTGIIMNVIALATGAIWGKTSWGTWWDWDPKLTSFLILLFVYIGYLALQSAIEDTRRSDKASALLALVGLVLVPVIYYAVNCPDPTQCASLHQESSLERVDPSILKAMLVTTLGFWMYSFATILMRVRNIILQREQTTSWVSKLQEINQ